MKIRYIKVFRDLTSDYSKNAMLVLSISIGVFGIGAILGAYKVINREMRSNYIGTVPASATIEIHGNIQQEILEGAKRFPGISAAERRATIVGRMYVNERWNPILLFVIDDFTNMELNKYHQISGTKVPPQGAMLVERTALQVMNASEGDSIAIRTSNGVTKKIKIVGTVHDPGLAPAWQEEAGYAYLSLSTLQQLDPGFGFDLLRIQVAENKNSTAHITSKAEALADWLKSKGVAIHEIQVPPPGKHPHQSQMNAVLTIFIVFSFMILVLGSILVATSMATLTVKHVRQIGVMKTIGGTSSQIIVMYILMLLIICGVALIVGIPLSRFAASAFNAQIATLLNLSIADSEIPLVVPVVQILSGILIPLMATSIPLIRGARISVRAAIDNYGLTTKSNINFGIALSRLAFLSETIRLSLRNVFRQSGRLLLTLGLLAAGGAMFMTALNVSAAWDENLKRIYVQRKYDQEIKLNDYISPNQITAKLKSLKGVAAVEGWNYAGTSLSGESNYEITRTYPDKGHGSFVMLALPVPTQLLNPTLVEGRWLYSEGTNDVVLNQLARSERMKIGDEIALNIDGNITKWKIAGFTEDIGSSATAYVSLKKFAEITGTGDKVKMLRIAYIDRSQKNAATKSRKIDQILEAENLSVSSSTPVWLLHNAVAAHMKVLVNSLLAMAVLMAIVGTLGLMSSMSMSILERTREIGIMRAIGATPQTIRTLIVSEGLIIGLLSIVLAFLLSLLLSYYMGEFIGAISFKTSLTLTISTIALLIWIVIITVGSYIATVFPARRANSITTREALAYE